jgi:hypothetical protein
VDKQFSKSILDEVKQVLICFFVWHLFSY